MWKLLIAALTLIAADYATSQIIPPLYRCADLGDNSTCHLENVTVSKSRPNFRIRAPDPNQVRSVFIEKSTIPLLMGNICANFLNMRSLTAANVLIEEVHEDAFKECFRLISVDLSKNALRQLPENLFWNNQDLNYLYLEGNFLKELPDQLLKSVTGLSALSLGQNRIKDVPFEALKNQKQLKVLQLHSNDILNIDEDKLVESFPDLQTFEFNNNQMSCDRLFEVHQYLIKKGVSVPYTAAARFRYHNILRVAEYWCLADDDWTGVYYKRVGENKKVEELEGKVKELEEQISSGMDSIKELLAKVLPVQRRKQKALE